MKKNNYTFIMTAILLLGTFHFLKAQSETGAQTDAGIAEVQTTPHRQIVVYYFYWLPRCYSCQSIEMLTKETVALNFKGAAATGTVVYKAINTENSENKHYEKAYRLLTKSVIISEVIDGKEKRWKNCDKIWYLYDNDKKFIEYLTKEIHGYFDKNRK